ncbi:MAG TPA: hypothetical protein VLL94_15110 [Nitrospiraceae bacterium]|nr:hypothetical protein [Nitrospiraceae bacterium]
MFTRLINLVGVWTRLPLRLLFLASFGSLAYFDILGMILARLFSPFPSEQPQSTRKKINKTSKL